MTTGEVEDRLDMATAGRLLDREKPTPMACCPRDGEPLVMTMERAGAEFLCMVCGSWYGFLSPTPKDPTPDLDARYKELLARFRSGERP